jgi:1-acyl-sn-glycerol-3-phosphate acyltransferase
MALFKTIFIFFIVIFPMILIVPLGIVIFLLRCVGMKKAMSWFVYRVAQFWARLLIMLTGCRPTVTGRENIPRKGGVCFVGNHGSIFDIILLLAYTGRPIGFIAKKELAFIPFLNIWILLIGGRYIDRKTIRKAVSTIHAGVRHIKDGGAMIIFPEGHRSRGQGLLPFHPGSFKLATESLAPIVPVAISGSYEVFEKTYRVRALPVRVSFGKPIITADILPAERRKSLSDQVYGIIKAALES